VHPIGIDPSIPASSREPVRRAVDRIIEESKGKITRCLIFPISSESNWCFHFRLPTGSYIEIRIRPDRSQDSDWLKKEVEGQLHLSMDE